MITRVDKAGSLADEWDTLAVSYCQTREFLAYLEKHNPCRQRYYQLFRGSRMVAGVCVYSLALSLLTFSNIPSPLGMQIVGVPCSQSAPGVLGGRDATAELLADVVSQERGLLIGLNLDHTLPVPDLQWGRTLPAVVLDRSLASFDDYALQLRSSYRRRLQRLEHLWDGVVSERGSCSRFDRKMYDQYLHVFGASDAKLEKLPFDVFPNLPGRFTLTTHRRGDQLLGWHIGLSHGDQYVFFLVGLDAATKIRYHTHANILSSVIREGLEGGARRIDLGQTAEVAKTRAGGKLVEKHLFAYHRRALFRMALGKARGVLEYGRRVPDAHVFRTDA